MALDVARILVKHADELAETDMADEVLDSLAPQAGHRRARPRPARPGVHGLHHQGAARAGARSPIWICWSTRWASSSTSRAWRLVGTDKVAARNLVVLREWADRPRGLASRRVHLHFWTRPVRILGGDRVSGVEVERTALDADGAVVGRGESWVIPAQLVVRSVGYRGEPLPGVPHDAGTGRVPHAEGRVIRDGGFSADEYVTGWVKRGPTGVIGTNKSDAVETVTSLLHDVHDGELVPQGRIGALAAVLAERGIEPLGIDGWHRIDAAEVERVAPTVGYGPRWRTAASCWRRRRPWIRLPPRVILAGFWSDSITSCGSRHKTRVRNGEAGRAGGTSGRPGSVPGCA